MGLHGRHPEDTTFNSPLGKGKPRENKNSSREPRVIDLIGKGGGISKQDKLEGKRFQRIGDIKS